VRAETMGEGPPATHRPCTYGAFPRHSRHSGFQSMCSCRGFAVPQKQHITPQAGLKNSSDTYILWLIIVRLIPLGSRARGQPNFCSHLSSCPDFRAAAP
jgi:hypothetical protein